MQKETFSMLKGGFTFKNDLLNLRIAIHQKKHPTIQSLADLWRLMEENLQLAPDISLAIKAQLKGKIAEKLNSILKENNQLNNKDRTTQLAPDDFTDLLAKLINRSLGLIPPVNKEKITFQSPELTRWYEQLQYAHQQSIQDMQAISDNHLSLALETVYVERSIEQQLLLRMHQSTGISFVSGEGGVGKTSLLWHLAKKLESNSTVFLIKSSQLLHLHLEEIVQYLVEVQGKKVFILIDTIDLLLHSESNRDRLCTIFSHLKALSCCVVASSRPQELQSLLPMKDVWEYTTNALGEYDERELTQAIQKYTEAYVKADNVIEQEYYRHVMSLVANGTSLLELCSNPLTLRMLFSLYAPQSLPQEINVFSLYLNYYDDKVIQDKRQGLNAQEKAGQNMAEIAEYIALVMLKEGKPEVSFNLLKNWLGLQGKNIDGLKELATRGIIFLDTMDNESKDKSVRFFHQTFFEHVAARAVFAQLKGKALAQAEHKILISPEDNLTKANDLFLMPILEQLVLFTNNMGLPIDKTVEKMIRSEFYTEKAAGFYVYCLLLKPHHSLHDLICQAIVLQKNRVSEAIKRFLKIAPSMLQSRTNHLFKEISLIWNRNIWNEMEGIVMLLQRLSKTKSEATEDFLQQNNVLPHILSLSKQKDRKEHLAVYKYLFHILENISPSFETAFTYSSLLSLIGECDTPTVTYILKNLVSRKLPLSKTLSNDIFLTSQKAYQNTLIAAKHTKYPHQDIVYLIAHIRAKNTSNQEFINELKESPDIFEKMVILNGLAINSGVITKVEASLLLEEINNPSKENLYDGVRFLFKPIFQNPNFRNNILAIEFHKSIKQSLIEFMQDNGTTDIQFIVLLIQECSLLSTLKSLFMAEKSIDETIWTTIKIENNEQFIIMCYIAGYKNADAAYQRILQNPKKNDTLIANCLFNAIKSSNGYLGTEATMAFFLEQKMPEKISLLLKNYPEYNYEPYCSAMIGLYEDGILQRSAKMRTATVKLLEQLIESQLYKPSTADLLRHYHSEDDSRTKSKVSDLIINHTSETERDFYLLMEELHKFSQQNNNVLAKKASKAYVKVLCSTKSLSIAPYEKDIMKIIFDNFDMDTDAEKVASFGDILNKFSNVSKASAVNLLMAFLHEEQVNKFSDKFLKNISHTFRKPIGQLLIKIEVKEVLKILALIPHLHYYLGHLFIHIVFSNPCLYENSSIIHLLDKMIAQNKIDDNLIAFININKVHKIKEKGSAEGWDIFQN